MNPIKIGGLIAELRHTAGLTQLQLANILNVSDRTVSKWECGQGLPDISMFALLADTFGVNVEVLLSGEMATNDLSAGNMQKANYFVCPECGSFAICMGGVEITCCGKPLAALIAQKADVDERLTVEQVEDEWYITANHPMTKEHYISFVALLNGAKLTLIKQYPEWNLEVRLPRSKRGILLWYCTQHGLFRQILK